MTINCYQVMHNHRTLRAYAWKSLLVTHTLFVPVVAKCPLHPHWKITKEGHPNSVQESTFFKYFSPKGELELEHLDDLRVPAHLCYRRLARFFLCSHIELEFWDLLFRHLYS